MAVKDGKITFRKGEKIIYPFHGRGKILGLVRKDLVGGLMKFYEIQLDNQPDASIYVPLSVAKGLGLRRPMRKKDVANIMTTLKSREPEEDVELNWRTWKKRYEEQKETLRQGSATGLAAVVRNLHEFSRGRSFSSKELRQLYEDTHEQLVEELAEALGSKEQKEKRARQMVEQALKGNAKKEHAKNSAARSENSKGRAKSSKVLTKKSTARPKSSKLKSSKVRSKSPKVRAKSLKTRTGRSKVRHGKKGR